MRIIQWLRLLIGSFLVLFLLIFLISLFFPSKVRVSRAMNVKASATAMLGPIGDMRRWTEWNPFLDSVDHSGIRYEGSAGQWPEKMVLNEITVSWIRRDSAEWVAEMKGLDGKKLLSGFQMITHAGSDSSTLQWYMDFHMGWLPWEKFGGLLIEKSYGPRLEQGLMRLRQSIYQNQSSH